MSDKTYKYFAVIEKNKIVIKERITPITIQKAAEIYNGIVGCDNDEKTLKEELDIK